MTRKKTDFKIDENKIRARLAECNGYRMATEHELEMVSKWGGRKIVGNSGWNFSDDDIKKLIKDGLIQKESDLDNIDLDGIETIEDIQSEDYT